jgi:NADH:ubiquinone oxidoreductase subunit 6 (subunit J)
MTQYLWPFEVVSVLLLVALVGAIVIAAKDEVIRKKAGG